jgi:hypothetical protein
VKGSDELVYGDKDAGGDEGVGGEEMSGHDSKTFCRYTTWQKMENAIFCAGSESVITSKTCIATMARFRPTLVEIIHHGDRSKGETVRTSSLYSMIARNISPSSRSGPLLHVTMVVSCTVT